MRVLICGGRDFADLVLLHQTLNSLHSHTPFTTVIHGGARGADKMSEGWAETNAVPVEVYPADWGKHGKAAGPIRNQVMLECGAPDLVVAFPHPTLVASRGTRDMVDRAKKAGLKVLVMT